MMSINLLKNACEITYARDWRNYTKDKLVNMLKDVEWCKDFETVQDLWNDIESKIIRIVDVLVPVKKFINKTPI